MYFPHNDQLGCTDFPHNALSPQCITCTYVCVRSPQRPTTTHRFSPQCTFPTMYHLYACVYFTHNDQLRRTDFPHNALPHNVSLVRMCVYVPHNDQLGRTDVPHNTLSPQSITCTYVCVRSPQRPTVTHGFSPQCTFPTMYHLYVCVYFPHNDHIGRTDFPHNALSPQCIVGTYRCVCVLQKDTHADWSPS